MDFLKLILFAHYKSFIANFIYGIALISFFIFRLLRQKKTQDENFTQICRLRQGAAKYSLEQIVDLPVSLNMENNFFFLN